MIILISNPCVIICKAYFENQVAGIDFEYVPDMSSRTVVQSSFSPGIHPFLQTCSKMDVDTYIATSVSNDRFRNSGIADPLIELLFLAYGNIYGRTKGDSCLFYPTCSHFSTLAIEQYGFLTGISMTAGRLIRSHTNFSGFYPEITVEEGKRYLDLPQHEHFKYYAVFSSEDFIHAQTLDP